MLIQPNFEMAKIGLEIDRGAIDYTAQPANLQIETKQPLIQINKNLPKITIDQTRAIEEIGLRTITTMKQELAHKGLSDAGEYRQRKSRIGDMLMDFHINPDGISKAVEMEAWPDDRRETNVDCIPKTMPSVEVEGNLSINLELGRADNQTRPGNFNINSFRKANVSVYLRQKGGALTAGSKINTLI